LDEAGFSKPNKRGKRFLLGNDTSKIAREFRGDRVRRFKIITHRVEHASIEFRERIH